MRISLFFVVIRRRGKMKKIAITLLLAAFAAPAIAGSFYVGVKTGWVEHDIPTSGYSEIVPTVGVFGGYAINKFIAIEAESTNLGSIVADRVKITTRGINAVVSLPIEEQLSLFLKLGQANTQENFQGVTANRAGLTFGVGSQFYLNESMGLRFSWDHYSYGGEQGFHKGTANLYTVGGMLRF